MVFELCALMPTMAWANFCEVVNAGSYFSVGDRSAPFEICADISLNAKVDCYGRLFGAMHGYAKSSQEFENWCQLVKEAEWKEKCR